MVDMRLTSSQRHSQPADDDGIEGSPVDRRLDALEKSLDEKTTKILSDLAEALDLIKCLQPHGSGSSGIRNHQTNSSDQHCHSGSGASNSYSGVSRLAKLDIPRFNGDKITEWLFKVEKFFELDRTPDAIRIGLPSNHFDGFASNWHRSLVESEVGLNGVKDWTSYKILLKERFCEIWWDPVAELKQLQETNGIVDYHRKFELLRSRVNLCEEDLLSAFLAGLRTDTTVNIRMFHPQTVEQCLRIGRLYESVHPIKPSTQLLHTEKTKECIIQPHIFVSTEKMTETEEKVELVQADEELMGIKDNEVRSCLNSKHSFTFAAGNMGDFRAMMMKKDEMFQADFTSLEIKNEESAEYLRLPFEHDKEQMDFSFTEENAKFEGFHLLERANLTKEESALRDIYLGDCDMVLGSSWFQPLGRIIWDFKQSYMRFLACQREVFFHDVLQGSGILTRRSKPGDPFEFLFLLTNSEIKNPASYVWQRWKNKTSLEKSVLKLQHLHPHGDNVRHSRASLCTNLGVCVRFADAFSCISTMRSWLSKGEGFDIVNRINYVSDTWTAEIDSKRDG